MQEGQAVNTISALFGSDKWSNSACCGYVILACKNLGYTKQESQNLLEAVNSNSRTIRYNSNELIYLGYSTSVGFCASSTMMKALLYIS